MKTLPSGEPNSSTTDAKATLHRVRGHLVARCHAPECRDINGRPWQRYYSKYLGVEGQDIAVRDVTEHNRFSHAAGDQS